MSFWSKVSKNAFYVGMLLMLTLPLAYAQSQSAIEPASDQAKGISYIWWSMFWVALVIFVAVMLLLGWGLWKGRSKKPTQLSYLASRNLVVIAGVAIPLITVLCLVGGSLMLGRSLSAQPPDGALEVRITGWMWWWQIEYLDDNNKVIATTANELHIPVNRPIKLYLESGDVIHSFWVPQLHGKTDLIPGRTNSSWFEANVAGTFRGQCAEFCGLQHALMGFLVVAESKAEFQSWLKNQQSESQQPKNSETLAGQQVFFKTGCQQCHTIRGTDAAGTAGPDLTHLASRESIAAVTRKNSRAHLGGWIADPNGIKPGAKMPLSQLNAKQLSNLLDYLQSLD
ncbi:cytochrome c oxidase subunit II [Catenovulum adriaticum]|uniref:cytochrome-c oxidase n=1 Tax=Catenovulum adriaticum TaxID=2984846 RepID=A0ABY7ASC4_9ALTE|nr:cytochrome c oxidase subunit II [Catenovulum sp. TS8]WAJ71667.1 cytochrome c oxidase subunit II [Catenovulum sp. TS8]